MGELNKIDMNYGCKWYEGTFELLFLYPNYFDEKESGKTDNFDSVHIKLRCYVIGPHRHYDWYGKTIEDVVKKARKSLESLVQ